LASKRSRDQQTVGSRLIANESAIADLQKSGSSSSTPGTNSVGQDALQPNSVGSDQIIRGSVGSNELGAINQITTDSYLVLNGPNYPAPGSGLKVNLAMDDQKRIVQTSGGGGGNVTTISATAPVAPSSGDAWVYSVDGTEFVYYNDGNSSQWVETGNVYAKSPTVVAPNLVMNGACRTNQDGYVSGTSIPIGTYAFDGWKSSGVVNLFTNPTAGASINGASTGSSALGTITRLTAQTIPGLTYQATAWRSTPGSGSQGFYWNGGTSGSGTPIVSGCPVTTKGKTYRASLYVRTSVAKTLRINLEDLAPGPAGTLVASGTTVTTVANTWQRLDVSGVAGSGSASATAMDVYVYLTTGTWAAGETLDVAAVMLTEGSVLYPYFDGATTDCSWSGTANASTSYNVPNVVPTLTGTFDSNFGSLFTVNANGRVSQIVERSRVPAGVYLITHSGTATIRVYNNTTAPASRPAFQTAPFLFTADGTDDVGIEFSGGGSGATFGQVRMFAGTTDYGFSLPNIGDELSDCERYFHRITIPDAAGYYFLGTWGSTSLADVSLQWEMRAAPFATFSNLGADSSGAGGVVSSVNTVVWTPNTVFVRLNTGATGVLNGGVYFRRVNSGSVAFLALDARIR